MNEQGHNDFYPDHFDPTENEIPEPFDEFTGGFATTTTRDKVRDSGDFWCQRAQYMDQCRQVIAIGTDILDGPYTFLTPNNPQNRT